MLRFFLQSFFAFVFNHYFCSMFAELFFTKGEFSYYFASLALTIILLPRCYYALSHTFAVKTVFISKEEMEQKLENEFEKLKPEDE
jgi:hypothetical protein